MAKMRRVMLTLEVETDVPLRVLRSSACYIVKLYAVGGIVSTCDVLRAQANVIRKGK